MLTYPRSNSISIRGKTLTAFFIAGWASDYRSRRQFAYLYARYNALSGRALKGTSRRRFKRYQFWLLIEHPSELVLFGLLFFGIGAGGRFGTF